MHVCGHGGKGRVQISDFGQKTKYKPSKKVEKFMAHSGCGAYKGESQLSESGAFSLVEGSAGMA